MPLDILNKFSNNLKNTLVRAINLSIRLKHPKVLPIHLLISLSQQTGSVATEIIAKHNIETRLLQVYLQNTKWQTGDRLATLPQLSQEAIHLLEHAAVVAFEHQHKFIGTEHLLLSIVEMPDKQLEEVFKKSGVNTELMRKHTLNILSSTTRFPDMTGVVNDGDNEIQADVVSSTEEGEIDTEQSNSKIPALEFFSTNLTEQAVQKNIDPVVGRDKEIERLIHILSRRTKNNPVLLGEPGVGKTAIVEGLAKRIIEGDVPDILRNKKIYRLDLGLVVAGTMYRGEFEARFKQITEELKENEDIIMFIDEIHTLIGAGGTGGNAMDAANILKPGLARGEIRCIGATTLQEYQKHIESDPALERRLQPIIVAEPSMEESMQVLKGIRSNYEDFHHIKITDEAIEAAVKLSVRYIQDKFLPDKAIDLIDEAAARCRIQQPSSPAQNQYAELEKKLDVIQHQKISLVREEKFEEAVELKKKERAVKDQLKQLKNRLDVSSDRILGSITEKDIAAVVARMTNVPMEDLIASEKERLLQLNEELSMHVLGQEEATKSVAEFIKRSRAGLNEPNRPIGSFMFLGPSGVGKTELAKTLARVVFGSEDNMIRIDMSEYSEGFTMSKLIGAPAGYVGYKEGSKLTDQVKHKPYSLVLFDEIEKAHPDVFNILLQILEDGHLTDASGKTINFKNTIIIMTSNIGLQEFQEQANLGFSGDEVNAVDEINYEQVKEHVLNDLKLSFRPELINRIDKIIVFKPLQQDILEGIVKIQIAELAERAKEKGFNLTSTKALIKHIAKIGYTPSEGARAMRRTIQEHIENPLAEKLLNDEIKPGDKISMGFQKDAITFTKQKKSTSSKVSKA